MWLLLLFSPLTPRLFQLNPYSWGSRGEMREEHKGQRGETAAEDRKARECKHTWGDGERIHVGDNRRTTKWKETKFTYTHMHASRTHSRSPALRKGSALLSELTAQKTCSIMKLNNVGFDFWGDCLLMFASRLAKIAEYVSNIKSKMRLLI